ncbi:MAG TPA: Beta-galactosidase C-terminal domain, partial [Actinoplanes sp.]|nr:Beta-galactosidase C-terminal domain [Actinoplanes sp.]
GTAVTLSNGEVGTLWTERLHTTTAGVVATYEDGPMAGLPAITRNRHGAGTAWYIATNTNLSDLLKEAAVTAGARTGEKNKHLEVVRRKDGGRSYLFVINHSPDPVELPATGHDLITGQPVTGALLVEGGGVAVIREEAS